MARISAHSVERAALVSLMVIALLQNALLSKQRSQIDRLFKLVVDLRYRVPG